MKALAVGVFLFAWGYFLRLLERAGLIAWRFLLGCGGLFLVLMLFLRTELTGICVNCVCALAGIVGSLTHTFSAYAQYGILYIQAKGGSLTLLVNYECSGMIEVAGYLSLLAFDRVYDYLERWVLGAVGTAYLLAADAIRLTLIAEIVHSFGVSAYYAAHLLVGRALFYIFDIVLYYCIFTREQVARMKLESFSYRRLG